MTEREPHPSHEAQPLPDALVDALAGVEYACLTIGAEAGTPLPLKAPRIEIESARGRVPIQLAHELYDHPQAPVIRMALRIYDRPHAPLAMETFINVADAAQRADYAALTNQDAIPLVFVDETLQQRLAKRISHRGQAVVPQALAIADRLLGRIPTEQFSFERGKQAVMEETRL